MDMEKAVELLKDLTLNDVMESGGDIDISLHGCKNIQEAEEKLNPYRALGFIRKRYSNHTHWLNIEFDNDINRISISAFYDVDGDEK